MIGQTLSHYRIIKELGKGGMGIVYLAEDMLLGRQVAIKMLKEASRTGREHNHKRFLREAQNASKLSHPHIATIHDFGETPDGRPYIVMEYVKGKTLSDLIQERPLTLPLAVQIVTDVAEALSEAHRNGIVHRDIKPSNVAINERGVVKVLDFGLAKHLNGVPESDDLSAQAMLDTRTREGVIVCTPEYSSPEQAMGVAVDARSDLFSLGSVLYECITGKRAFSGLTDADTRAQVIRDDPPPPSTANPFVSAELDRLTLKALAKKPEERYQTAGDFITDLDAERTRTGNLSAPVTRSTKAEQNGRSTNGLMTLWKILRQPRSLIGYVAATTALLLLLTFVGYWLTRSRVYTPTGEAQNWLNLGVAAMREGAYFKAIKPLQEAIKADQNFVLAHARLAEAWTELDYSDKAKDEFLQIEIPANDFSNLSSIDKIRLTAIQNTIKRDYATAVKNYQILVTMVAEEEKAYAYLDLGRAYTKNQETIKALESYAEATRRNPNYGAAFLYLGLIHGRKRQFAEADAGFDQAQRLFDISGDQDGFVEVLLQRGVLLAQQGKISEARVQLMQALQRASALENKDKQIKALLNLSYSSILAGDSAQAHQYSTQALELAQANGLENLTTGSLIDIGNTYLAKGDYAEAEKHFKEALKWAELYKGGRNTARALLSLASLSAQQLDPDHALDYVSRALPFYEQGGYAAETSQAYTIKGRALNQTGEFEAARAVFTQQLDLAQKANDPLQMASAHENLGLALGDLQRYPKALAHFREQQRIAESIVNQLSGGYAKMNSANMLWQLGRYQEAESDFASILNVAKSQNPPNKDLLAWTNLFSAQMALSQVDFSEAIVASKRALALADSGLKPVSVRATYVLGLAESLRGRREAGRRWCENAVQLAREMRDPRPLSDALLALSEAALNAGDGQAALSNAAEAQRRFEAAGQHESEWRAWAIQARARLALKDREGSIRLSSQARDVLAGLEKDWNKDNYSAYLKRPDVIELLKLLN